MMLGHTGMAQTGLCQHLLPHLSPALVMLGRRPDKQNAKRKRAWEEEDIPSLDASAYTVGPTDPEAEVTKQEVERWRDKEEKAERQEERAKKWKEADRQARVQEALRVLPGEARIVSIAMYGLIVCSYVIHIYIL